MDNLSNPNFQFTSVFGLLAISIENFCNLHIGGYLHCGMVYYKAKDIF